MAGLADILQEKLGGAMEAIKRNMDSSDFNATNKTKDSLAFEVTEDVGSLTGIIFGNASLQWAETGRPPRTSTTDSGLSDKILVWMQARNVGSNLTEKGQKNLARFITLKINTLGTKLFREGKTRDVYTSILEQTKSDLEKEIALFMEQSIITTFTKTFQ